MKLIKDEIQVLPGPPPAKRKRENRKTELPPVVRRRTLTPTSPQRPNLPTPFHPPSDVFPKLFPSSPVPGPDESIPVDAGPKTPTVNAGDDSSMQDNHVDNLVAGENAVLPPETEGSIGVMRAEDEGGEFEEEDREVEEEDKEVAEEERDSVDEKSPQKKLLVYAEMLHKKARMTNVDPEKIKKYCRKIMKIVRELNEVKRDEAS